MSMFRKLIRMFKRPAPEPLPEARPLPQPLRPTPMVGELHGLPDTAYRHSRKARRSMRRARRSMRRS